LLKFVLGARRQEVLARAMRCQSNQTLVWRLFDLAYRSSHEEKQGVHVAHSCRSGLLCRLKDVRMKLNYCEFVMRCADVFGLKP